MVRKNKSQSISMFMSVLCLLTSLLFLLVSTTGAWFTDSGSQSNNRTLSTTITTAQANLNIYQEDASGTETALMLPSTYTQLEYIEGTGTQWINTGVPVTYSLTTSFGILATGGTGNAHVGTDAATWNDSNDYRFFVFGNSVSYYDFGSQRITMNSSLVGSDLLQFNTYYDIEMRNFYLVKNGVKYAQGSTRTSSNETGGVPAGNISILRGYNNTAQGKFYYFKIEDNGTMIRNMIPAQRNSDGVVGMYDLANDVFYTNAGTGNFVAGAAVTKSVDNITLAYSTNKKANNKISSLPVAYTQLEYIECTGSQYVNTGFKPIPSKTKFEISLAFTNTDGNYRGMFGVRVPTGSADATAINFFQYNDIMRLDWPYSGTDYTYQITTNTIYNISCEDKTTTINGVSQTGTTAKSTTRLNYNFYIGNFANGSATPYTRGMMGKIYSARLYDGGILVRDMVPARRNADGVVGMYDIANDVFYTNAGTGNFVAGTAYANDLKLILKNEDKGASFGIKYKVVFYVATKDGKKELNASIGGMTAPTSTSNGFVYNAADGYYYYKNSSGANKVFEAQVGNTVTEKYLMKYFTISPDDSGSKLGWANSGLTGGESILMEIIIENVNIT